MKLDLLIPRFTFNGFLGTILMLLSVAGLLFTMYDMTKSPVDNTTLGVLLLMLGGIFFSINTMEKDDPFESEMTFWIAIALFAIAIMFLA